MLQVLATTPAAALAVFAVCRLEVFVAGICNRDSQTLLGDQFGIKGDRRLMCVECSANGFYALDGAQNGVDLSRAGRALEAAYFHGFGLQGSPLYGFALHDVLVVVSEPG